MKTLYIVLVSILLIFSLDIEAQFISDFEKDFTEAERLLNDGYLTNSMSLWKKLSSSNGDNANVNYKTGYCQLRQNNNKKDALSYLEKAVALQTNDNGVFKKKRYDPISAKEENAPIEAIYYLGEAYLLNYELDKAKAAFTRFTEISNPEHKLASNALRGIEMTENARYQVANERNDIQIHNIGPIINGAFNDFSPVLSADENALFFTSRRIRKDSSNTTLFDRKDGEFYEDIYVSYRDRRGKWQEPELLNINSGDQHSASINVSINGQRLFIYDGSVRNGDIFESVMIGEVWSNPETLPDNINTKNWETHCALSADENTLYFVSNIEGGFGKRDIYSCVLLPNGEWSKALSLGPVINTAYDEDAVYIHPDGKTLYFSSKGHNSMGGFDIFKTSKNEEGIWAEPTNLGYPINTVEDDVFFITSADNRRAYFSSDRAGGYGYKDIYVVDLPEVPQEEPISLTLLKGYVTPPLGESLPEDVHINITNISTGEMSTYRPRIRDGAFIAILPPCETYSIEYFVGSECISEEELKVDCDLTYREIQREILLAPVHIGGGEVVEVVDNQFTGFDAVDEDVAIDPSSTSSSTGSSSTGESTRSTGSNTTSSLVANYELHFGYNEKDLKVKNQEFIKFMKDVSNIVAQKGRANIIIEGSASRVPTRKYSSNKKLANIRAEHAKQSIIAQADKLKIDTSKLIFVSSKGLVQGPNYKHDFDSNRLVYEQYQYVRLVGK